MFNSKQVEEHQDLITALGQDVNTLFSRLDYRDGASMDLMNRLDNVEDRLIRLENAFDALAAGADSNFQIVSHLIARVGQAIDLIAAAAGKELYKTEEVPPSIQVDPGKPSEIAIRKLGSGAKREKKQSKKLSARA